MFWRLTQRVMLIGMLLALPAAWYVGEQWKTGILPTYLVMALILAVGQWRRIQLLQEATCQRT